MKVSQLMQEIVQLAEEKFGTSDHENDLISIGMSSVPGHMWEVYLERPSQRQLDYGEIDKVESCKVYEYRIDFYTVASSLMEALRLLKQKVEAADYGDFQSVV